MSEPDYMNEIVSIEYFESNQDFARKVIDSYNHKKEMNCSWYGPRKPFFITHPKLIDNYHLAKKSLKNARVK